MSDKSFKVKSGLTVSALSTAGIVKTDSFGVISSSSILGISEGGTGQTTANNSLNALLPIQNGSTINYTIQSDGTNVSWAKLYNQTIKNAGITVTPRRNLNFVGATITDDAGTDTTTITINASAMFTRWVKIVAGGETSLSGNDDNSISLSYTPGYEIVILNGINLVRGIDYVATTGTSITGLSALTAGDIVEIMGFISTAVADTVQSTTFTTKGDVLVATGNNTYQRVGIGSNNQVLMADSSQTAGVKWASATITAQSISTNTTLVAGNRYFVNTSAARTLTLPASPSLNDEIQVFDASGTANTYNITISRNSNLINGNAGNFIIDVAGGWYTLVYTGATYGWKVG